ISIGMALGLLVILSPHLRANEPAQVAGQFDVLFGLQERVSTALELQNERIRTVAELSSRQVNDALTAAVQIDASDYLPYEFRWYEWIADALLIGVLMILLMIPTADPQAGERA